MSYAKKRKNKNTVVIRESDFIKNRVIFGEDAGNIFSWTPITQEFLQQKAVWFSLKSKKYIADQYHHWPWPREWLSRTHLPLFNPSYAYWLSNWNENGFIEIRAGLRRPVSILGILEIEVPNT